jgi:50S ribosomal protein L16 3-hydroxylase
MKARTPHAQLEVRARSNQPLGMSSARFLRDYWQKRPLLIRDAFADFENPVAPDDLAGLACEELALARVVIEEKMDCAPRSPLRGRPSGVLRASRLSCLRGNDGSDRGNDGSDPCGATENHWTVRHGPFAATDFAALPKTHWTLLVQDVDKWDTDAAALLAPFGFLPSWRVDDVMVSYAEDGGSVGAHVDQYDVFLLQGLGRRRWQIDADAFIEQSAQGRAGSCEGLAYPLAYRDDVELKLLREFTPTHEWILDPGDMLYLPPGVPHHGIAVGPCMTYSIGMRAPSQAELLVDFADTLAETIPDSQRLTDRDLAPVRADGEIDDDAIARVMRAMPSVRFAANDDAAKAGRGIPAHAGTTDLERSAAVPASVLRAWFGRFITRYRSAQIAAPNPKRLTNAAFARARARGAEVQRNPWSRFAWMREAGGATLHVAGESHACSQRFARMLCAPARFPIAKASSGRDRALLRALIDAGHLAIISGRKPGGRKPGGQRPG